MNDIEKMQVALDQAKLAAKMGEVPVGAAIFQNDKLIFKCHNQNIEKGSPIWHAEMLAIENACKIIGPKSLFKCDIFVTLEPCDMCQGAIKQAGFFRLVFGAFDPKKSAKSRDFGSLLVTGGILRKECESILTSFFKEEVRHE